MKTRVFLFLCFLSVSNLFYAQKWEQEIVKKANSFKTDDNLEEYYYLFIEACALQNDMSTSIDLLQKAELSAWRKAKTVNEKKAFLHFIVNKAYYFLQIGAISKSVDQYEKALLFYQENKLNNYDIIAYCLKPLGNNYTRLGDYVQADEVFKYTIQLAGKRKNKSQLIATYQNLSIKYQAINNYQDAIALLKKALRLQPISKVQKSNILSLMAKNYFELKDYKKAIAYVDKSDFLQASSKTRLKNLLTKGLCFFNRDNLQKAENLFLKALTLSKQEFGVNNRETAKIYNLLAAIYSKQNLPNKALTNYQTALQTILVAYQPKTVNDDPIESSFYAENTIKEALDGRAIVYSLMGNYSKAIVNYNLAFKADKVLQSTYTSQDSKIMQQAEVRLRTEKIVALNYKLYQKNNSQKYVDAAFIAIEKTKALVLYYELNSSGLRQEIQNDSLLFLEQKLVSAKAKLIKNVQLERLKNKNADLQLLKKWNVETTQITTKLQVLKQELQVKYPFLKTVANTISITKIQEELLLPAQQLITYFDTKEELYIFSLTKDAPLTIRKFLKTENYKVVLQNFIDLFERGNDDQLTGSIDVYQTNANYLYQQLLANELQGSKANYLTIIPDNKLNFLTFEALLTKKSKQTNFATLPYLLFKFPVNYGYSTSILYQQKKVKKSNKKEVLGFFPVFENNHRQLQEIAYTLVEEKEIKKYNNGIFLEKEKATKKVFLDRANKYSILHLSTHASTGTIYKPAHIEFREEALYLPEIYGLQLNNDLMVLSACETGVGRLQKGEGVMSLARGFSYAGVKSVLVSLWKVNDKATSVLMRNFYKNLKKTESKTVALHQSKVDYLLDDSISNIKKTPYYWSSFVFIGNVEKVNNTNYMLFYFLLSLAILLVIIFYKRNFK